MGVEELPEAVRVRPVEKLPLYVFRGELVRVKDGDTFVAALDHGLRLTSKQSLRLAAVDAPEHWEPGGEKVTEFVKQWMSRYGGKLLVRTFKTQSFDRWLAAVWPLDDPDAPSLNEELVRAGHAVPFRTEGFG